MTSHTLVLFNPIMIFYSSQYTILEVNCRALIEVLALRIIYLIFYLTSINDLYHLILGRILSFTLLSVQTCISYFHFLESVVEGPPELAKCMFPTQLLNTIHEVLPSGFQTASSLIIALRAPYQTFYLQLTHDTYYSVLVVLGSLLV